MAYEKDEFDPGPRLRHVIGHFIKIRQPKPERVVEVKQIAHSFVHPTKAEINGEDFISYLDLFLQLEGEYMSDGECEELERHAATTATNAGKLDRALRQHSAWRQQQEKKRIEQAMRKMKQ